MMNQFTIQLGTDKGEIHNTSRFIYMLEGFSDKWIKTEPGPEHHLYVTPSWQLHSPCAHAQRGWFDGSERGCAEDIHHPPADS